MKQFNLFDTPTGEMMVQLNKNNLIDQPKPHLSVHNERDPLLSQNLLNLV